MINNLKRINEATRINSDTKASIGIAGASIFAISLLYIFYYNHLATFWIYTAIYCLILMNLVLASDYVIAKFKDKVTRVAFMLFIALITFTFSYSIFVVTARALMASIERF